MKNRSDKGNGFFRLVIVIIGAVSTTVGILAIRQGHLWGFGSSPRLDKVGLVPMTDAIVLGIILILIGIIPWERFASGRKGSKR